MRDFIFDVEAIRDTARGLAEASELTKESVSADAHEMEQLSMCWGNDAAGQAFGTRYCPLATVAMENVLERARQMLGFATLVGHSATLHEKTEQNNVITAQSTAVALNNSEVPR